MHPSGVRQAGQVIVRSWSARLQPGRADEYVSFFRRVVHPHLQTIPGCHGAKILMSVDGAEVVVQTVWTSLDAIRGFAGDDISRAVVEPEAAAMFIDYDRSVRHYTPVEL